MNRLLTLSLLVAGLCAACAGPQPTRSGFLPDYDRMKEVPGRDGALAWATRRDVLLDYDKFLIDSVTYEFEEESDVEVSTENLSKLGDALRSEIETALGKTYPVVQEAGPRVVRLRLAITHIVPTRPVANTVTQVPPLRMASLAHKLLLGTHLGVGRIGVEAEFRDAVTGEELIFFSDMHVGSKLEVVEGTTRFGQLRVGFRQWAEALRKYMDEVRS